MFGKKKVKTNVVFNDKTEGSSYTSTSALYVDKNLVEYISSKNKRYKDLIVETIIEDVGTGDYTIELSTVEKIKLDRFENNLHEFTSLIAEYAKERAIGLDVYVVLAKGELKGVFGREVNTRFKKDFLIRDGYSEEDIQIIKTRTDKFEDINIKEI